MLNTESRDLCCHHAYNISAGCNSEYSWLFLRVLCKLRDWRLTSMKLVGKERLANVTYTHTSRNGAEKHLPVLPSDHFGLLLTLEQT